MRLNPDSDQRELQASVRTFLERHCPMTAVREAMTSEVGYDPALWLRMAGELGLPGLAVSERGGGSGFGITELALAMEECGAGLVPGPMLGSGVFSALVLDAIGDTEVLPEVASGKTVAALLVDPSLTADAPGVVKTELVTMDPTRRQTAVELSGVPARKLGGADGVSVSLDRAAVVLAAESLGVMRRSMELVVEYAKVCEQFGRKIGSFQGIKHGLADVYASYELAFAAVSCATWAADHALEELPIAVALCQGYVFPQAFEAAFQMIQYHGGVGFTWEHDAHLYFKRAKTNETLLGTAEDGLVRIAAHLFDRVGAASA